MQNTNVKITVNTIVLEDLLFQSHELIRALYDDAIVSTMEGVLKSDKQQSAEANAYEWVSVYYEQVTNTINTVNTALTIITDALANMDIEFTPYKRDTACKEG